MSADRTRRTNGRRIKIAVGLLLVLGAGAAAYWYLVLRGTVSSDDARIDGSLVDLAPEVSGTLAEVLVQEGDRVRRDQPLFRLDRTLLEAARARAQAQVLSARAGLTAGEAKLNKAIKGPRTEEIRMAREAVRRAEAQARLAKANWIRSRKLGDSQVLATAQVDQARTRWETASHARQEALDRLHLLRRGTRREDQDAARAAVAAARARVTAAEAALKSATVRLSRAGVRAPFDGVVVRRWRDPGAMLAPGVPVLTLMNPATLHVAANVEEKDLARFAAGDPVRIEVDAYPGHEFRGHVARILRATNSKFSLIPAEGSSGTFIKVTQRVPIRVTFDTPPAIPLSPGLSVEVEILASGTGQPPAATAQNR
jgi:membrane fusion protein (multidrug efflux system)